MKEIYKVRAEVVNALDKSPGYITFLEALGEDCTDWHKTPLFNKYGEFYGVEILIKYKGYRVSINTVERDVWVMYGDGRAEVGFYDNEEFNTNVYKFVEFFAVRNTRA